MKYKKNHYIPEFYLKSFSVVHPGDRNLKLWVYGKEPKPPRKQSPKDTATINGLYLVTLPRFYRHLSKEETDEIGGAHASTSATSVYGGI